MLLHSKLPTQPLLWSVTGLFFAARCLQVASLQEALYGLEATNARLEKRLAAAQAAGYNLPDSAQSSPSAAANSAAAAAAAMAAGLSGAMGGSGWASVSSSGPAAELTAADLATGAAGSRPGTAAAVPAAAAAADTATAVDSVTLEQSRGSVDGDAAAAAGAAVSGAHEAAVLIKAGGAAAAAAEDAGKSLLARSGLNITDGGASEGGRITAYRPSRGDTAGGAPEEHVQGVSAVQSANASSNGVGGSSGSAATSSNGVGGITAAAGPARGAIDQAAAQQLRALVAEMQASLTPEQVAGDYAEVG